MRRDFIKGLIAAFVGLLLPCRSPSKAPRHSKPVPLCDVCGKPATWETVDTIVQDVPVWSRQRGRWQWRGHIQGGNHLRCNQHHRTIKHIDSSQFEGWLAWRTANPNGTGDDWLAFCKHQAQ